MKRKSQPCKKASGRVSGERSHPWQGSDARPVLGAAEGQQGALGSWSAVVGEGQRVRLAGPRLCRGLGTVEGA